jgi:hypothetical protein
MTNEPSAPSSELGVGITGPAGSPGASACGQTLLDPCFRLPIESPLRDQRGTPDHRIERDMIGWPPEWLRTARTASMPAGLTGSMRDIRIQARVRAAPTAVGAESGDSRPFC